MGSLLISLESISVIDNREEDMQCLYLSKNVKLPARKWNEFFTSGD